MPKLASKPTAPTQPQSPPPEPSWLTGPALKAATEHLFATQRAKKASDRAKGKAHSGSPRGSGGRTSSPVATTKVWTEVWTAADDGDWPELPTSKSPPLSLLSSPALRPTQDRCEVPLAALVRPVKLRGAQAKGTCDFDSSHTSPARLTHFVL